MIQNGSSAKFSSFLRTCNSAVVERGVVLLCVSPLCLFELGRLATAMLMHVVFLSRAEQTLRCQGTEVSLPPTLPPKEVTLMFLSFSMVLQPEPMWFRLIGEHELFFFAFRVIIRPYPPRPQMAQ